MPDRYGATTVRLGILNAVKALYVAAVNNEEPPEGKVHYGVEFSVVEIGPLGDPDTRKLNAIGIVAGEERKSNLFPLKTVQLPLAIEFRITANKGDPSAAVLAERMLGVVQQIMYDGGDLGSRVVQADEVGNEVDLYTYADRTIEGVVRFMLQYRHHTQDVYSPHPSA